VIENSAGTVFITNGPDTVKRRGLALLRHFHISHSHLLHFRRAGTKHSLLTVFSVTKETVKAVNQIRTTCGTALNCGANEIFN
jgi:hypothetical protein